jgi:zinc transport system ATP-binding protein
VQLTQAVIEVERLCVEFDGEHVLEDVNLRIASGEVIALLGPNGSGKSTLVRAILGLQPIDHGRVSLFGTPLRRFKQWQRIALVPQRLPGASSIPVSVWETVLSGAISPRTRWRPFSKSEKNAATQALKDVDLWDRRHSRLDALSGGQQRRVLVARALASSADIIVMDEPTAGLDAANVAALARLLGELKAKGSTIIVVTHEIDAIESLVTRAIVLGPSTHHSVQYDGPPPVPNSVAHDHHHHHDAVIDEAPPVIGMDS